MHKFFKAFLFAAMLNGMVHAGLLHDLAKEGRWDDIVTLLYDLESDERSKELNSLDERQHTVLDIVANTLSMDSGICVLLAQLGARKGAAPGPGQPLLKKTKAQPRLQTLARPDFEFNAPAILGEMFAPMAPRIPISDSQAQAPLKVQKFSREEALKFIRTET